MLTARYIRQSRSRRRLIDGVVRLLMFGLLITISIRMQDPITYFLVVGLMVLAVLYGTMRTTSTWLDEPLTSANRYRLAWLSARRRAIITRARLQFHTHRSWN